jgi:membrane peptidoglycan carboxypeptidase
MRHHGFIPSEFRSALIKNLRARKFRFGASSITMQMVKNVLLYREKTLSRKLQELFLTWVVEKRLGKSRILEIYLNAIEYGPALYGIGPAAKRYFGKHPRDLNPVEAAFFSSILPSPKARYRQYCNGELFNWTAGKIERILALLLKRGRLTQQEFDAAAQTPLQFDTSTMVSAKECNNMVSRAIHGARPTNPLKK